MLNDRWLIVLLFFISLGLVGCNSVCPDQTKVEVGVTETDSKNDKMQEKRSITQTWKWGKTKCQDR
jgi:uncharacterized protein YceK|tara:strand:+ start:1006 stop:1203 length:198 start_codon:yes stop_codon:yes gene_type:complete